MPKIVFYDLPTRPGGPLFSPNTTPCRLALLHKGLPFVTVELTAAEFKSSYPGSLTERLNGARTTVPMIELPVDEDGKVVEPTDEGGDCRGQGLVLLDSLAIASLLDQFYPNKPSLFLPEVEKVDVGSKEWRTSYNFALLVKQGLGTSFSRWAYHFELSAEGIARNMEGPIHSGFTSDSKHGEKDGWKKLCSLDKAHLLGETRRSLLPFVALLSPPEKVISSETHLSLSRLPIDSEQSSAPLFLTSPTKHGIIDYLMFGRFAATYATDLKLSSAIWSFDSEKAREWLKDYDGGKWEVKQEVGEWDGDVELPNVQDWTERMLDLFDGHAREQLNRERR